MNVETLSSAWKGSLSCSECSVRLHVFRKKKLCFFCKNFFCQPCIVHREDKKLCCRKCQILTARPLDRNKLLNLKSRDLVNYLSSRQIPTNGCVEKEDLVNVLMKAVNNSCYHPSSSCLEDSSSTNSYPGSSRNNSKSTEGANTNIQLTFNVEDIYNEDGIRIRGHTSVDNDTHLSHTSNVESENFSGTVQTVNSSAVQCTLLDDNIVVNNEGTQTFNDLACATDKNSIGYTTSNSGLTVPRPLMLCDIKSRSDLVSLSVKQLKELLMRNRTDYRGCIERDELIEKAYSLWNDYTLSKKDLENLTTDELCKICMDAPIECVLLECGHMATCTTCGKQLCECPICRQFVVRCVRTFKA